MTSLVTDEMLMALADGEIDRETAAGLLRQIDADPELKRRFAAFGDTRVLSKAAFAEALEEPVPPRLIQAAGVAAPRAQRRDWSRYWLPFGAAVAAAAVGLVVGVFIPQPVSPLSAHAIGPEIAAVLDNGASGDVRDLAAGGRVVITGTFLTPEGACRTFDLTGDGAVPQEWHEVACRRAGVWEPEMAVAGPRSGDAFVPAADRIAESIAGILDALGAGEALDETAERQLRDGGWRNDGRPRE